MTATVRLTILSSALLAAGCAGEATYSEPPPASPTYVQGATVAAPTDDQGSAEVVYVDDPPVVDIETYPSVVYEGTTVYFVGGYWYQRGPRGWGYFRNEPPTLARARVAHQSDARWARAQRAPAPRQARAGEPQREAPRGDVRATPEQTRPEPAAARREEARPTEERAPEAKPAGEKKPGEGDEHPPAPAPKKRPVKRTAPPPRQEPERR
jgi:hypothetical protein